MTAAPPAADPSSRTASGWIEATGYVFVIGALSLVYAIGHRFGAHPMAFVLYAVVMSSIAMLAATGVGNDTLAIARHPMSWLVGASIILVEVFYYLTISYVPPAHGNLIPRFAIPMAMITGWALFGRRPAPIAIAATVAVTAASSYVVAITDPAVRWHAAGAGLLCSAFLVVRGFAGEFHPWNRAAVTAREKLRVTGTLLLVTSILSLVLASILAGAVAAGALPPMRILPTAGEMLHLPTILIGTFAGGGFLALLNILQFSAVVKITTENITAMMALSPLTTWLFQEIGVALGLIDVARPESRLVAAMAVIVPSVLVIVFAGRRPAAVTGNRAASPRRPGP